MRLALALRHIIMVATTATTRHATWRAQFKGSPTSNGMRRPRLGWIPRATRCAGQVSVPSSPGFGLVLDEELFQHAVTHTGLRLRSS